MKMKEKQTLLIDADDTLWENNIHFEKAIVDFVNLMKGKGVIPEHIEDLIRCREMENVKHFGYGSESLCLTMEQVYRLACDESGIEPEEEMLAWIDTIRHRTGNYPIELLTGVESTLPVLKQRHRLILVTKGNQLEQTAKVERSGVKHYFETFRVVPEKNENTYLTLIDEFELNPEKTWMIGNSPKSDINPAKKAGLGTVFVPYHTTWAHEMESVDKNGRETIMVKDFSELLLHF